MKQNQKLPRHRSPKPNQTTTTSAALPPTKPPAALGWLLAATVFGSAFFLFQVQPLICKAVLHWFGGTPAVWTTSMFFFQVMLLLGYIYADLTSRWLAPRTQLWVHVTLVIVAVLLLPIRPSESWKPDGAHDHPRWQLLGLLFTTVGAQFFLLSTTAPLLQVWWHRMFGDAPYRLYAWSNAGSFLALLSFPFLVEPLLGVRMQIQAWSAGFFLVACSLAYCGFRASSPTTATVVKISQAGEGSQLPRPKRILTWLLLSATGSVLLLAMTSHLTQNVAVVPFLWVAPLALYLLSFVLCFANTSLYRRGVFGAVMILAQIMAASLYHINLVDNLVFLLAVYLSALFAGCMVCHGELARLKPDSEHLTLYFVIMSAGGALGGFLVSVMAPALFPDYYEYPIVLIGCWMILLVALFCDEASRLYRGKRAWAWLVIAVCCFVFLSNLRDGIVRNATRTIVSRRSFYGVLSVRAVQTETQLMLGLYHGIIKHGLQNLAEDSEQEPTSYYQRDSGLGYAMQLVSEKEKKRVGMLGLGIGTIAAYSAPGDYFRAYEINQDVIDLALDRDTFSFWSILNKRGAQGDVVLGDARISLENELRDGQPQNFDILVMDVFSGDAIPVHLLTVEAFQVYQQHLAPHGLLAVHISNRHLDLLPVIQTLAEHFSIAAGLVDTEESRWVIMGSLPVLEILAKQQPDQLRPLGLPPKRQLWTDDFSNILSVLK